MMNNGAYIRYVGGGAGGFYKLFRKNFVAQKTIDLIDLTVVPTVIFKFQITKEVNIHNDIQKIIFK